MYCKSLTFKLFNLRGKNLHSLLSFYTYSIYTLTTKDFYSLLLRNSYTRGGQPKLVSGPQLGKFAKNIDFLGHNMTKVWENTPKTSKNSLLSIRAWAAETFFGAAGWPPLSYTNLISFLKIRFQFIPDLFLNCSEGIPF
jgi:hypothetical protein